MVEQYGGQQQTNMAFKKGDLITATELNNINSAVWSANSSEAWGWKPDYKWYSHRPNGALLCSLRIDCGWFGGIRLRVALVDSSGGTIQMLHSNDYGWSTHTTVNVNSVGQGWYRVWAVSDSQIDSGKAWNLYAYQTDCTKGNKLTYYDNPWNSGNRKPGTPLTVAVCNSGLCGTIN